MNIKCTLSAFSKRAIRFLRKAIRYVWNKLFEDESDEDFWDRQW